MHVSLCTTALCCTRTVSLRRTRTVSLTVLRADKLRGMKKLHAAIISIFISIFAVEAQPQYQYLQYSTLRKDVLTAPSTRDPHGGTWRGYLWLRARGCLDSNDLSPSVEVESLGGAMI